MRYDVAVIGNGLIGSAAARYLSQRLERVCLIGSPEPSDLRSHDGVFSSHYDQGRLVSSVAEDPIWSALAAKSMRAFEALQDASGITFHGPVGRIRAVKPSAEEEVKFRTWLDEVRTIGADVEFFDAQDRSWQEEFPYLAFPAGYALYVERAPAGYVNPRQLLAAQNAVALSHGAEVVSQLVTAVEPSQDGVTVRTADGSTYTAEKVLVTCGAFTNFGSLIPEPLPLRLKTESIVLGTVTPDTAARLETMPCVGYDIEAPGIDDIYIAPPLRYPDGQYRIKMGCNTANELWPQSLAEVQDWFRSGDSDADLPAMERALRVILPDVPFDDVVSHRCIVTYTPSGYPTIDHAPGDGSERVFVATGGNGAGAHVSDALGHLGAGLLSGSQWPDDVPRAPFLATNLWGASRKELTKAQERAAGRGHRQD